MLRFALCVVALSVGGCTFGARITGTSVVAGDERGVIVSHVTTFTYRGAFNIANAWCGHYKLVAQETTATFLNNNVDFACVRPPRA
jgi:hypothetical protein